MKKDKERVIIMIVGPDTKGIIARVTTTLAEDGINTLDINQTIMDDDFLTMIMVCDISEATVDLKKVQEQLNEDGEELGVKITVQHENIFDFMHRI